MDQWGSRSTNKPLEVNLVTKEKTIESESATRLQSGRTTHGSAHSNQGGEERKDLESHQIPPPQLQHPSLDGVHIKAKAHKEQNSTKPIQIEGPRIRKTADFLNENLIKGYLHPKVGELPFLQPRRTLDQYFYTHLEDTSKRDSDQVIYRHTVGRNMSQKMFMVDQLWFWILNEGKLLLRILLGF